MAVSFSNRGKPVLPVLQLLQREVASVVEQFGMLFQFVDDAVTLLVRSLPRASLWPTFSIQVPFLARLTSPI
jgi:hypothetical protein